MSSIPEAARRAAPALVREVLQRHGFVRVRAHGGSMMPAIHPGDVLNVRAVDVSEVVVGDVVLFERDGRLFAHRVVGQIAGGLLRTRGDANEDADPEIEEILGVVEAVESGSRFRVRVQGSRFKVRVPGSTCRTRAAEFVVQNPYREP